MGPPRAVAIERRQILAAAEGSSGHAVIVQNNGRASPFGEIGYHLALALKAKGLKVTMFQDKCKNDRMPFNQYKTALSDDVRYCHPGRPKAFRNMLKRILTNPIKEGVMPPVTHIFDNFNKDDQVGIEPLIDLAKESPPFKIYAFIS